MLGLRSTSVLLTHHTYPDVGPEIDKTSVDLVFIYLVINVNDAIERLSANILLTASTTDNE